MSTIKLSYFNGRGLAEKSRWMLVIADQPFEDFRHPLTFGTPGDLSTLKQDEFLSDKAAGLPAASLGKVPVLEVNGVKIPQSKAIERYVARKFGFMGANDEEAACIDAFSEHDRDAKDMYQKAKKEGTVDKFFAVTFPEFLIKVAVLKTIALVDYINDVNGFSNAPEDTISPDSDVPTISEVP